MVVKNPDLAHNKNDLGELAQYIQHINSQPEWVPSKNEFIKTAQDIINYLARAEGDQEQLWSFLQSVEEYFLRIINLVNDTDRHEVVWAILDKFYSVISDPQKNASPATSVVLVVLVGSGDDNMLSAARWLVQKNENGAACEGLKTSLSCMYSWMCEWTSTMTLDNWVIAFIKALEEKEKYDILIEVSVANILQLFMTINDSKTTRESTADVIFHILAGLRETPEAFEKISPHINVVLTNLAVESGQWSRHLLQTLVDILTTTIDQINNRKMEGAKENFKNNNYDAITCLGRHMPSRTRKYVNTPAWRTRSMSSSTANPLPVTKKTGLMNHGNKCYMNSITQALLVTRQFSSYVMLRMYETPYWSKMAILFAKMTHSISLTLDPNELYTVVKPPFFSKNGQHDSSEFLGYLFVLLQSYEFTVNKNYDYSHPPFITSAARLPTLSLGNRHTFIEQGSSATNSQSDSATNSRRASSPRPSSSAGSSSGNRKRAAAVAEPPLTRKRLKMMESVIDNMFSGVLLTRIQCTACRSHSLSRDVFRELQLAFPEKPEGDMQHSVQGLLEYYCSMERMSGDNKYHCSHCGLLHDAEKLVLVESTPKYLILVLKNFRFEPKKQTQTKLMQPTYYNYRVTMPIVKTTVDRPVFHLYAAVIHEGPNLNSGHYYTVAKDNNLWYVYNDEEVTSTNENLLNKLGRSSTPYILFYRRNDIEEGAAISMDDLPPFLHECVVAHNKNYVGTVHDIRRTRP